MKLYGCKGCGSAAVEAVLQLAGTPYEFIDAIEWQPFKRHPDLERLNPLGQVPVLLMDDGSVMTESAAMLLYFGECVPGLVPDATDPAARAACLRWLVFFPANLYSIYAYRDFPARWVDDEVEQKAFRERTNDRLREVWRLLESELNPAPYALGSNMTVVDLFLAMCSRWGPGRQWVSEHCPKLMVAIAETEKNPVVAKVWEKNFGR